MHFTECTPVIILDDSQDPFAFDEDDTKPSKWDLLSGKQKRSHSKKHKAPNRQFDNGRQSQTKMSQQGCQSQTNMSQQGCQSQSDTSQQGCQSQTNLSQQESSDGDIHCSKSDNSDKDGSSLLTDCLLTAVKVFY